MNGTDSVSKAKISPRNDRSRNASAPMARASARPSTPAIGIVTKKATSWRPLSTAAV